MPCTVHLTTGTAHLTNSTVWVNLPAGRRVEGPVEGFVERVVEGMVAGPRVGPALVGLAPPRASWPSRVSGWTASGALAADFLACHHIDEVLAVLAIGRPDPVVLLDGRSPCVDRDSVAAVRAAGARVVGIDHTPTVAGHAVEWDALGCGTVLGADFGPQELLAALRETAHPMGSSVLLGYPDSLSRGRTVAVRGSGGTGSSTVAMCLAQGLARQPGRPILVDGCRRGDLDLYHGLDLDLGRGHGTSIAGLAGLAERSRRVTEDPCTVDDLVVGVAGRGYDLLPAGARDRPPRGRHAVGAALDCIARAAPVVVVDHDGETEASACLARRADAWVIVVGGGLKGARAAMELVGEATDAGVDGHRIVVAVNGVPRSPISRRAARGVTTPFAELRDPARVGTVAALPRTPRLELAHRHAAALPATLVRPVTRAVEQVLARVVPRLPPAVAA